MNDKTDTKPSEKTIKRSTTMVIVVVSIIALSMMGMSGMSIAQSNDNLSNSSYYDNHTGEVDNESWTEGHRDPTLANATHYLTRVGGFVIGDGGAAQGGGSANGLIVGLMFMGAFSSVAVGGRIGSVGGVVLGVAGMAGLAEAAIAPSWFYVVLLFIVGALMSAVAIRFWR